MKTDDKIQEADKILVSLSDRYSFEEISKILSTAYTANRKKINK